ncbi:MAG: PAS domain S-box protein [Actinomycetota bacterium]|nr:PAS domain S-box protein [Actinomycetota bacterium]MDP9474749.1 PAS domain S-box protein [Actinomycetota bacterium]
MVHVVDASSGTGSVVYASPRAEGMLDCAREEWLGDPELWAKVLHRDDRERVLAEVTRAREAGEPFGAEYRLLARDGRVVWVRDGALPVRDAEGRIRHWHRVLIDVTDRKRAEEELRESEERFRVTFDAAAVGMAHAAPDGRWLRVNDKLSEIVGYSREELRGMTLRDITHPDDLIDADPERASRMLQGRTRSYSTEKRCLRKEGSVVWIKLTVSLIRGHSGEPRCFVSVIEDITERKLAELVPEPLTPRELDVLGRVASGQTNSEIASAVSYSEGMIKHHVHRILVKLGVSNRSEAASRALEIGLLPARCSKRL